MKKFVLISGLIFCYLSGFSQKTGTFTDDRDGKEYNVVKIGDQWIMENFAFNPNSRDFLANWSNKDSARVAIHGCYYNWEDAKMAIPKGWHLPTNDEWTAVCFSLDNDGEKITHALKNSRSSEKEWNEDYWSATISNDTVWNFQHGWGFDMGFFQFFPIHPTNTHESKIRLFWDRPAKNVYAQNGDTIKNINSFIVLSKLPTYNSKGELVSFTFGVGAKRAEYSNKVMVVAGGRPIYVCEGYNKTGYVGTKYFTTDLKETFLVSQKGKILVFSDGDFMRSFKVDGEEFKGTMSRDKNGNLIMNLIGNNIVEVSKNIMRQIASVNFIDSTLNYNAVTLIQIRLSFHVGYLELSKSAQYHLKMQGVTKETLQNVLVDKFVLDQNSSLIPNAIFAVDDDHKVIIIKNKIKYEIDCKGNSRELK